MQQLTGIVAGWRRKPSEHGILLTLQVAQSEEDWKQQRFTRLNLALNDRQLRSLARDLVRAAEERNLEVFAPRPWWRFWQNRSL